MPGVRPENAGPLFWHCNFNVQPTENVPAITNRTKQVVNNYSGGSIRRSRIGKHFDVGVGKMASQSRVSDG